MKRRDLFKWMGAAAALPVIGKLAKEPEKPKEDEDDIFVETKADPNSHIGIDGDKIGFYGASPVKQIDANKITSFARMKKAFQHLGLFSK